MHHERRLLDRLEVFIEIGLRKRLDAVVVRLRASHHSLAPPIVDYALGHLGAGPIEAVERTRRDVSEELCTISGKRGTEAVEDLDRETARVGRGLDHDRRDGADQDRLGNTPLPVSRHVAGDFTATGRMPDVDGAPEV